MNGPSHQFEVKTYITGLNLLIMGWNTQWKW